jgi:hypothetical protein
MLEQLEEEYREMTERNSKVAWTTMPSTETYCLAISTLGQWKLNPYSWQRLQAWLEPLRSSAIFYTPRPTGEQGQLHFTLQQCQPFNEARVKPPHQTFLNPLLHKLRGIELVYRGLAITPSGIVLKGFPRTEQDYQKILNARKELPELFSKAGMEYKEPYTNTICHATLLRWTKQPTEEQKSYLLSTLSRWEECVFATLKPYKWIFGHLTLRVREECILYETFHTPEFIAHRGLQFGSDNLLENRIELLEENAKAGMKSECDVWWRRGNFYLGHDHPATQISLDWLIAHKDPLLLHAKDIETFHKLKSIRDEEGIDFHIFYHTDEDVILTTYGEVIVYPGVPVLEGWVSMMPEMCGYRLFSNSAIAYCSDYLHYANPPL